MRVVLRMFFPPSGYVQHASMPSNTNKTKKNLYSINIDITCIQQYHFRFPRSTIYLRQVFLLWLFEMNSQVMLIQSVDILDHVILEFFHIISTIMLTTNIFWILHTKHVSNQLSSFTHSASHFCLSPVGAPTFFNFFL